MIPARKTGRFRRWLTWLANAWGRDARIAGYSRLGVHMAASTPSRRLA